MCNHHDPTVELTGTDGASYHVNITHYCENSVWFNFGPEQVTTWNARRKFNNFTFTFLNEAELNFLLNLTILDLQVDTDLILNAYFNMNGADMSMSVFKFNHSPRQQILQLSQPANMYTYLNMQPCSQQLSCVNIFLEKNYSCGVGDIPNLGTLSEPFVLLSASFGNTLTSYGYTVMGSYYKLNLKLAQCFTVDG